MLERRQGPAGIALTRQAVPVLSRGDGKATGEVLASAAHTAKGGYVLAEASGDPQLILIATGSEVSVALEARVTLESQGVATRVVSMPCVEWFEEQDADYRESVLPVSVRARVSLEAGISQGWHRYVGDQGASVSIEHFGASADYKTLFAQFGITAENVVATAQRVLSR